MRWPLLGRAKARRTPSASAAVKPATSDDELHHLFLPYDDTVGSLQGALLQRMVVVPRRSVTVPLDELGHRAALDTNAGPDEGHLVCQVQQVARLQPLGHLELRRRLQQEYALAASRR